MVLKEITDLLRRIAKNTEKILEFVKPIREPEEGIQTITCVPQQAEITKEFYPNRRNFPAVISFRTTYHGWLELQSSNEWEAFEKRLLEVQKKDNQRYQPM